MSEDNAPHRSSLREEALRVLVVDDDVDSADVVAAVLGAAGHITSVAYTAEDALQLALGFDPDVTLVDLSLGGRSGYELAEAFRAHDSLRRCRFVALTGHAEESARRQSEAAGFHRHLTKPVERDVLFEAVSGEDERPSCAPPKGWSKQA